MTITKQALNKITVQGRVKLALALNVSEQWIIKLMAANKPNGPLTTYSAIKVIREETGLTDKQILAKELEAQN